MEKNAPKEIREIKLLYAGIAFLVIIALFLILILFVPPLMRIRKNNAPTRSSFDIEQVRELLSAPEGNAPIEIPQKTLNALEGRGTRVVPSQEMYDMLSAPPRKK